MEGHACRRGRLLRPASAEEAESFARQCAKRAVRVARRPGSAR